MAAANFAAEPKLSRARSIADADGVMISSMARSLKRRFICRQAPIVGAQVPPADNQPMLDDDQKRRDANAQQMLAANFAEAMEKSGVSPRLIAEACDVTEQAVSNWKRTGKIRTHFLPIIADATGWSLRRLITGEVDAPRVADAQPGNDARLDPELRQAIDDLHDLGLLDPDATAKLLSDLHNAADKARAIARRAAAHAPAPTASAAARRGKRARSELTLRIGDGNPDQGVLPLVPSADPFNDPPSDREAQFYDRIAKDRERHPR